MSIVTYIKDKLGVKHEIGAKWGNVSGKPSAFPPDAHNHSASDINSGTLPIERGGTGATTAEEAEYNIIAPGLADRGAFGDGVRLACMQNPIDTKSGVFYGFRTALNLWNYIKGKLGISSAVGSTTNPVYVDANGQLKAVGGTMLKQGSIIDTHPENSGTNWLDGTNEWYAFFDRGGTCTAYEYDLTWDTASPPAADLFTDVDLSSHATTTAITKLAADLFNSRSGYTSTPSYSGTKFVIYDLALPAALSYTTRFFYSFGNSMWAPAFFEVLVYSTGWDNVPAKYTVAQRFMASSTTGHAISYGTFTLPTSHTQASGSTSNSINRIRIVMSKWSRISCFGATYYGTKGLGISYMSRTTNDEVYRTISPAINNKYDLGSSSHKWANIYATNFNGSFNGNLNGGMSVGSRVSSADVNDTGIFKIILSSSGMTTQKPITDGFILHFNWDSSLWATQLFLPSTSDSSKEFIQFRTRKNKTAGSTGAWSDWGDLPANITGNANTATKALALGRNYTGRQSSINLAHEAGGIGNTLARVDLVTSSISEADGRPNADGFVMTFNWDSSAPYDTQIFIPNGSASNTGIPKIRFKDNKSEWGAWGEISIGGNAATATLASTVTVGTGQSDVERGIVCHNGASLYDASGVTMNYAKKSITATTFNGNLVGNADTATKANKVAVTEAQDGTSHNIAVVEGSGDKAIEEQANLTAYHSTNDGTLLRVGNVSGEGNTNAGKIDITSSNAGGYTRLKSDSTAYRLVTFPDKEGTVILNTDVMDTYSATGTAPVNGKAVASALSTYATKTEIDGKQDKVVFDGTYNASTNKVATESTVTGAINNLSVTDTAVAGQVVSAVSEANGKISVTRRALVASDIPALGYIPTSGGSSTGRLSVSTLKMVQSAGKIYDNSTGSNVLIPVGTSIFKDGIAITNPTTANDVGWIRVTGTSESDTVLEIATGDDAGAGEVIKVRQYNTSGVVPSGHEITLMDKSGNQTFNTVTATGFVGNLTGDASTASAAKSGSALETAINGKANAASVTGATKCKVTYNSQGVVTAGADLAASDIPDISGTYIKHTDSDNVNVAGTTKKVAKTNPETLFVPNGLVMGGSAAAAGLVTRGVCGVSVPDANGACTKEHLYVNYDGDNSYRSGRQLILQAGTTGAHYGYNLYQYAAARGDSVKAFVESAISTKQDDISSLIPTAASASNPLCDKAYADAIGERLEARYLGCNANGDPFATHATLTSATKFYYQGAETTPDTNDITTVIADEDHKNTSNVAGTTRYRYGGVDASGKPVWAFEYVINNTGLSQAQLLAVNSGITATKVGNYDSHLTNTTKHITADERTKWNGYDTGKQDKLTEGSNITISGNTISATDTTYSSKAAASGGTDVSLVTTGEKYTWNSKGTYSKPSGGIPKTDLASAVQTSLDKADSALQSVSVTDSNPTLSWGTKSTVGTIAGTNVSVTMPANPNTDYRVTQSATTTANYRPLLMGARNETTHTTFETATTDQAYASNKLYAQPSTGLLAATSFRINDKADIKFNSTDNCIDFTFV